MIRWNVQMYKKLINWNLNFFASLIIILLRCKWEESVEWDEISAISIRELNTEFRNALSFKSIYFFITCIYSRGKRHARSLKGLKSVRNTKWMHSTMSYFLLKFSMKFALAIGTILFGMKMKTIMSAGIRWRLYPFDVPSFFHSFVCLRNRERFFSVFV